MKKFQILLLCGAFLFLSGCFQKANRMVQWEKSVHPEQVFPRSEPKSPNDEERQIQLDHKWELADEMREAYQKLIYELEQDGELAYHLIDLDGDEVPELVADRVGYRISVYTYANEQIYTLIDGWPYGAMGNHGYEYIPGKNTIRNYNADLAGAILWVTYGQITENYQVEEYYPKGLSMWLFRDLNDNYSMDEGEYVENPDGTYETYYYYGEQELTVDEFHAYLIEGDYQWLGGKYSAEEMLAWLSR